MPFLFLFFFADKGVPISKTDYFAGQVKSLPFPRTKPSKSNFY